MAAIHCRFHAYCVGVSDAEADTVEVFACPRCCERDGTAFAFATAAGPPVIKRTRRPALSEVAALVAEASARRLLVPAATAMSHLLEQTVAWRGSLADRLGGDASHGATARLVREADSLEVVPPELKLLRQRLAQEVAEAAFARRALTDASDCPVGPEAFAATLGAVSRESNASSTAVQPPQANASDTSPAPHPRAAHSEPTTQHVVQPALAGAGPAADEAGFMPPSREIPDYGGDAATHSSAAPPCTPDPVSMPHE